MNETFTFLEKSKNKSNLSFDSEDLNLKQSLVADTYFEFETIEQKLEKAINTLPEKQKLVFMLRYYDEMPYKDMAEILETSEGALKASYHHSALKIKEYFERKI